MPSVPSVVPPEFPPMNIANHSLRLAIVRQRYNPYCGAERFIERALGALVREGAEITLITRNWSGAPQEGFR